MMNALDIFDGSRAIARLLILLHDKTQGIPVTTTHRLMKKKYGVARTATDSSLKAAIQLGLVEQYESEEYKVNILTPRGDAVAAKVKELEEALTGEALVDASLGLCSQWMGVIPLSHLDKIYSHVRIRQPYASFVIRL